MEDMWDDEYNDDVTHVAYRMKPLSVLQAIKRVYICSSSHNSDSDEDSLLLLYTMIPPNDYGDDKIVDCST